MERVYNLQLTILVKFLNGLPVSNIGIEALCLTCTSKMIETSTTDQAGMFRIRGLQPKQKYSFNVNLESDRKFKILIHKSFYL